MLLAPDLPHFLDYLLARLYKRCPYMIPEYHDEAVSLWNEQYSWNAGS